MKKKIGMIVIAILIFTAAGMAVLGNEITATEFANTNIDAHDFGLKDNAGTLLGEGTTAIYSNNFPIETFEKQEDGKYKEVPTEITVIFKVEEYSLCRLNGETKEACVTTLHDEGVIKAASQYNSMIDGLKEQQELEKAIAQYASELKTGDITITAQEILTAQGN